MTVKCTHLPNMQCKKNADFSENLPTFTGLPSMQCKKNIFFIIR